MNGTRTGIPIALVLVLAACGSRATVPGERIDRDVISQAEMLEAGSSDAYSIVQSLRPQWLSTRGVSTISLKESVKVYLDGSLLGGPEHLQRISVHSISSIRYMDSIEATQRWGLDHGLGAILVSTRREGGRTQPRLSP
jgi:hypothetical protein